MILVHPPIAKPSEPPPGVAKLLGTCIAHGIPCRLVDANLEAILHLLGATPVPSDTWGLRAQRNVSRNLALLRDRKASLSPGRYGRAVADLEKVLKMAGAPKGTRPGLGNYRSDTLSPVRSDDLIRAAETPDDNPFFPYFSERFSAILEEDASPLVGFSLNYLSQALTAFAMIGFLRKEHAGIKVALGGGLVTSWMRRPDWNNPFRGLVDHLVAGPGEGFLLSLFGSEAAPVHSVPEYGSLPTDLYLSPGLVIPYSASTGCYWNRCAFCPERAERNPYIKVPHSLVADDLETLVRRLKPSLIHIVDNGTSPSLMRDLSRNPPGTPWYGFARITEELADPDFCKALKASGCIMLKVGLESGDQKVLDAMQKGTDLSVASRALRALKEAGIGTYVYLLFGTPAETEKEARRTLAYTVSHADLIDFLNVALFNLPAHSEEAKNLDTVDFYEGDLSLYRDFIHPKGWDRKKVRTFLDREFRRDSAIAAILRRDPPVFTSNHAPFFC